LRLAGDSVSGWFVIGYPVDSGGGAMARAIELSRRMDAVGLRRLAARSRDAGQSRRLLALAAIAEGRKPPIRKA